MLTKAISKNFSRFQRPVREHSSLQWFYRLPVKFKLLQWEMSFRKN